MAKAKATAGRRHYLLFATIALIAAIACVAPIRAYAETLTVFAAASLKNAMDEISQRFGTDTGASVQVALAGSSALARQIENGAPADIFISASFEWMDYLEAEDLIDRRTRFDLLSNSIVLVAHDHTAKPVEIEPGMDFLKLLGDGHLAMALVDAVPAGIYGRAALHSLGIWDSVKDRVAQADNVRAALALVSSGEAPLGIVYRTDAAADDNVTIIGVFPRQSHAPIVYPVAAVANGESMLTSRFLDFLRSQPARDAFERQGFEVMAR
jgi:molybdate transport system substrate-binding protein